MKEKSEEKITKPKKSFSLKPKKSFLTETKGKLCFAFDFGEYATKIAVARISKGKVDVKQLLVIENGERKSKVDSTNIKEWKTKISRVFSQNNLNSAGQIGLCTINCRNYISRQLDIPFANDDDRQGLVAYEMSQSLSLDIETYFFQHKVKRTYENNGVKMCTVWAAAVPRTLCGIYYELLDSLRLKPLVMDINVNGIERLLVLDKALHSQAADSVVAAIDYGIHGTEVGIYDGGSYLQGTNVEPGESRLVHSAVNVLGMKITDIHNGNKLIIPPQAVYDILRQVQSSEPAKAFMGVVEEWLSEINAVIKRYNVSYPAKQISMLYLYGGSLQLSWLKGYLEKYLSVPVTILQTLDCCNIPDKLSKANNTVPQFVNALSLFLRS